MAHALSKFRDDEDLTLEAFGQKVGASKSQVWKWENGTIPRKDQMQKIIDATGGKVAAQDWYESAESAA